MRLILVLLLTSAIPSFCQDYIITTKGDSLNGKVKFLSYDLLDKIQLAQDKKVILTALQVRRLEINGETYKPARLGNAIRFMKVIKSGYLSLYGFKVENQSSYDGRLLIKLDGKAMEVPNLAFKKGMIEFLEDCSTVTEKIKSGDFGRKNLDEIIDSYNICINDKTKAISKEVTITETAKDKLTALADLRTKIEKANEAKSKDALDILSDIENKVKKGDTIPNYQLEALKSMLAQNPNFTQELEQLLSLIK